MSKLIIMNGVSGSGKSTLAEELCEDKDDSFILSTDRYWIRPDGIYDWNPKLLGRAHQWNFDKFQSVIRVYKPKLVIIDNTNLRFDDFKAYAKLAFKNGWTVEIVEPSTEWKYNAQMLFEKNTHNVPLATIERMLEKREPIETLREKLEQLKNENH